MNRAYAIIKRQYKNRKNVIKCSSQNFLKINKILNKNQILKVKNLKKNENMDEKLTLDKMYFVYFKDFKFKNNK